MNYPLDHDSVFGGVVDLLPYHLLALDATCSNPMVKNRQKTHMNTGELISFGAAQLDRFSRFYCFVYIELLQEK
jgi:hypothetical protein